MILVRIETSPEDIRGMNAAQGILTSRGGMTSHAALVARQMGKVCVAGCGELDINYRTKTIKIKGMTIKEGDYISINGSTGEVFAGEVKTIPSEVLRVLVDKTLKPEESPIYQDFDSLMKWADEARRLGVRTNADQPDQAQVAIAFGAEGIGLCRTEHMFFEGDAHRRGKGDDRRRRPGGPEEGACQAPSHAEGRLRRALQGDERPAGDHQDPRPAPPRIPAPRGEGIAGPGRQNGHHLREARGEGGESERGEPHARACAAAGSASSIPRSPRCRRGRFSRPPAT